MSDSKVTVENLIDGAIIEGFQNANTMFLESLEDSLTKDVIITEAGDVHAVLQQMIDDNVEGKIEEEVNEELEELSAKLAKVLS